MYFCPQRLFFIFLANCADSDEMQPYVAFHLGLHCLPGDRKVTGKKSRQKITGKKVRKTKKVTLCSC